MGFLRGSGDTNGEPERDDDALETDAKQADSLARIEAGGIPLTAERRLQALGAGGSMFTSGLSVNEFALLGAVGPRPLAQVLGGSVVRVGQALLPALAPYVRWSSSGNTGYLEEPRPRQRAAYQRTAVVCEVEALSQAWAEARRNALNRLSEEALQVGADLVVGVKLQRGEHDLAKRTIDYLISGTAIRSPGSTQKSWPLLSDLSVQDYWRLHNAGFEPAGLVAATAVVFASADRPTRQRRRRTWRRNQELDELSQAFHLARETVRQRLFSQAQGEHADGTVGVELSHTVHREELSVTSSVPRVGASGWNRGALGIPYYVSRRGEIERKGWLITMHGAGTAIRRRRRVPQYPPEKTMRMGVR